MNFALPPVILLLLILPGVLLRYAYRKGSWRSPILFDTILNELAIGLVISLFIHIVVYGFLRLFGYSYYFDIVLSYLAGNYEDYFSTSIPIIEKQFTCILLYFFSINAVSALAGYSVHCIVRHFHLDLKHSFFRFNNEWYYLLSGEQSYIDIIKHQPAARKWIDANEILDSVYVFISVVISHGSTSYIYWGILSEFYFNKTGNIDRLVLIQARRRQIGNDEILGKKKKPNTDDRFYKIDGDNLVIDYQKVNTINIEYRYIRKKAT